MTPEEFRKLGHELIDWVADYRVRAASLPITTRIKPGVIKAQFPADPPQQGEAVGDLLAAAARLRRRLTR